MTAEAMGSSPIRHPNYCWRVAQLVEHCCDITEVRGSSPRAPTTLDYALVAQLAEHGFGKAEVSGSTPLEGTTFALCACNSADQSAAVLTWKSQVRILPGAPIASVA